MTLTPAVEARILDWSVKRKPPDGSTFDEKTAIQALDRPRGNETRVTADNLLAHKSALVNDFFAAHPKFRPHFMPSYSSWLNQVEPWFSKTERHVIARGVFTSAPDLMRKLMRYIRHYNNAPKIV
jgi:transposase